MDITQGDQIKFDPSQIVLGLPCQGENSGSNTTPWIL